MSQAFLSISSARRRLLHFYDRQGRELPWRQTRDPYAIWVSEVMLQQTRVGAVLAHYDRFLARFPTLDALAAADLEDVLAAWTGLGYYRRARLLHQGACFVAEHHGGALPASRQQLVRIPGIGSYTAGAITSIAFGQREAAVDANVARVIARSFAVDGAPMPRARIESIAGQLADCARAGDVNQAMMDLGASVCTAPRAGCEQCPLHTACGARALGLQDAVPPPRVRKAPRAVTLACAVVRCGERALLVRRSDGEKLLRGMWELPTVEHDDAAQAAALLRRLVRDAAGAPVTLRGPRGSVRHDIVGRSIRAHVYEGEVDAACAEGAKFFSEEEMGRAALSALPLKILRANGFLSMPPPRAARAAAER